MNKPFLSVSLCVCLLAFLSPVYAQTKKQTKDSSVVIVFSESKSASTKKHKGSGETNVVKIAPLGFISGTFPLLYERRMTDFLTVQVGGGLTNKNYIRAGMKEADEEVEYSDSPFDESYYDEAEALYHFKYRKPKTGFMYTVEPRIYFESEAPEGSYLGIAYNFAKYKFAIPALVASPEGYEHKGTPVKEYENITDLMVHFGWQNLYDRISLEYSTAIGLRKVSGSKYVAYNDGTTFVDGLAKYKENRLNFGIGLKVGYHF